MPWAYIEPGSGFTLFSLSGSLLAYLLGFLGLLFIFFQRWWRFLQRQRYKVILVLLILIGSGLIIRGVMMNKKEATFTQKVIILGFDGLSAHIVEQMMAENELPSFSLLKEQGSYRRLFPTNPAQSPVAWAGFASGQNPGKNGVFDFIIRNPQDYSLDLSLSRIEAHKAKRVIKSRCFWEYTSWLGVPTVILGSPLTFPPHKVKGRMLSGMGVPDVLGTEGTFTFYTTEDQPKDKDIGGKVFLVERSEEMNLSLIGPRVSTANKTENVRVPFKVFIEKDRESVWIELPNRRFKLQPGKWSNWQEVSFKLGLFRKMRGICRFYLVQIDPEFKLYISPINFDPRYPYFPLSYPPEYSRELAEHIGLYATRGMPMDTWALNEGRITEKAFIEQVEEVLQKKKAILDWELARLERGVLFCYFESADIIQHMFWRYIDPAHPLYEEEAPHKYKELIKSWYKKMDSILGEVLQKIETEDTLIVLSDHGFASFRRAVHLNTWLRRNGYLRLKSPTASSGLELLQDIDWAQTRAYALGFGAIYINQQGREGQGIVQPGEEVRLLKEELAAGLEKWVDEKFNQPIIKRVYRREELFWGDYLEQTPDLYIGFNPGYRASWQTALGAVPEELVTDNLKKWSGSHLFDPQLVPGIIFANRQITKERPSVYDIAPTVLKLVGFTTEELKKCGFDGEVLF